MQPLKKTKLFSNAFVKRQEQSKTNLTLRHIQGGALLTALFIMTLVAIVATAMTTRLQLDIYRTRLLLIHDKMYLASQALTFWALNELSNKKKHFTQLNHQGMIAQYPKDMENMDSQIQISGGIYDLQGRFNLNNLVEKKALSQFVYLLDHTYPTLQAPEKRNLALAVKDWITPFEISKGIDTFTSYYLSQKPPYLPSNQLMQSPSELRLVKDVTAPVYLSLEPFITVLPESTPLNLNTAPKPVLMSLANGLQEAQINELVLARGSNGIKNIKDIHELLKKLDIPTDQVTTDSHYFLSVAHIISNEYHLVVTAYLKRTLDKKGDISVSILHETATGY